MDIQMKYREKLDNRPFPWNNATILRESNPLPMDYGGLDVPFEVGGYPLQPLMGQPHS
jgi:hypothetical protein